MNWQPEEESDGDEMNPILWIGLILVAIIIAVAVYRMGHWPWQ